MSTTGAPGGGDVAAAAVRAASLTRAVVRSAVVGGAVGLAASAAASALATHFARRVVTPEKVRVDDVRVLAVEPDRVVLAASDLTLAPGRYGLWTDGGATHSQLGDVIGVDEPGTGSSGGAGAGRGAGRARTVVRHLIGTDAGALRPGPGRWSGWFHTGDPGRALGLPFDDAVVTSPVGELPAWLVHPADGELRGKVWAVLVHGRGGTREECLRALPVLHRLGVPALVPSYRNDPGVPASPSGRYGLGDTEWEDVEAAVLHALDAGAREVVLVGWSMGGAIVLSALSRSWTADRVRAVVLDGPVLDWRSVLQHQARVHRVPPPLGRAGTALMGSPLARAALGVEGPLDLDRLDWVTRAEELRVPVLLLHGEADAVVPVGSSRMLAAARPDLVTLLEFPGAGHCREWNSDPDRWEREVARFLLEHL
ncbi:alpha/beta hydrolase family protein [Quadrisphaera setariae]|uniref:Alpha/beta fold hydrolase n=1 Tax=Quadrisphaera setariae TaxID=2593304 RepID=A0A5C8ZJL7_9ACTN|nr:alpha/beta fold hydrolase [Quadrisphaera setariae]TXR57339.1 alpha/beta fold hydrolase [Quadrisphaera setariae]